MFPEVRLVFAWLAVGVLAAEEPAAPARQPVPAGTPEPAAPTSPPGGAEGKGLPEAALGRLGHDDYQERLQAQEALREWGMQNFEPRSELLYEAYRQSKDPEVRLRMREVLRDLVIRQQPWDGEGYLGIRMNPGQLKDAHGELRSVVVVAEVREGTAAEEAGLLAGDRILAIDRQTFKGDDARLPFGDYIKGKKPGDKVELTVRREDQDLQIPAVLRRRSPLINRLNAMGGFLELPDQKELDEADFKEWLDQKEANRASEQDPSDPLPQGEPEAPPPVAPQ